MTSIKLHRRLFSLILAAAVALAAAVSSEAQTAPPVVTPFPGATTLPSAPTAPAPTTSTPTVPAAFYAPLPGSTTTVTTLPEDTTTQTTTALPTTPGQPLTLAQAEQRALIANPRISAARLIALAEGQVTRETRAADYPVINGAITAVRAHENSRVTAGALNNPILYSRAGAGAAGSALITDFGRTHDLIHAAHLRADAATEDQKATTDDVLLAVDDAFYRGLAAQSDVRVAQQTVATRTQAVDQITALTNAKLRSTLDLSFANVNLSQARLLLLDARNAAASALNALNALLGNETPAAYALVDDAAALPPPPADAEPLVQLAFKARPDLASAVNQQSAAQQFSSAEHKLYLPTLTVLGAAGDTPVRDHNIKSDWYGAAGANLNIPFFNGFLYDARGKEATFRAQAAAQQVVRLRDAVARDVRQSVLEAQNNFERVTVSKELLDESNSAFDLAQTRYQLGLSSVVELSQAQLAQTQAQIGFAAARYAYQTSLLSIRFQTGQ